VAAETAVDEVVAVNATCIPMKETLASHGTIKTHGTARMVEVEITEDGGTTILRTIPTLPQPNLRAIRTEGTRPRTVIRTTNGAGTEDRLSRRMIHGLRINRNLTEVVEEGTIRDMKARMAAAAVVAERMGTLEGEVVLLPIEEEEEEEEEVRRTAAGGMAIREVREADMRMAITVVDTTNPHRPAARAEVATAEAVVIILVEAINPADRTALVSSLTGTEEVTTKEVEVVGEGIDHTDGQARIRKSPQVYFVHVFLLL
jgi:hypothetical protein